MKNKLFLTVLAAVVTFSSCSNDNEQLPEKKEVVRFMVDQNPISRTSTNTTDFSTSFVENDQIGIYATGGATASNVGYKIGSDNSALEAINSENEISWTSQANAKFYAYYPYASSQASTGKVVFTVSDQDSQTKFNENDFLIGKSEEIGFNTKDIITLKFAHGLSLVQVNFTYGVGVEEVTEVAIHALPTAEWTYSTDAVAATGTATDIKMWKYGDTSSFIAMVPAQTLSASTALFTIKAGTKTYTYKPSGEIAIQKGNSKKFNLNIGPKGNVISLIAEIPVSGWTAEGSEETGEATETVVPAVELISAEAGTFSEETVLTEQTGKQNCVEGWNVIGNGTNATIKYDNSDGPALSIVSTGGSWYNSTLYYCTAEGVATAAKYKLTFDLKADVAGDIQLALMQGGTADNNYFIQDNDAQSITSYQTATTEWATKNLTFDLANIKKGDAGVTASTSEDLNKVLVYFTAKEKGGTKFYIRNVKLIEVK